MTWQQAIDAGIMDAEAVRTLLAAMHRVAQERRARAPRSPQGTRGSTTPSQNSPC